MVLPTALAAARSRRISHPAVPLVERLRDPACYPHPVCGVRVVETHISWVLLTGDYAYKIKKPVKLGFADFSTLELRRRHCEAELALNRRLAPALYLEVIGIAGTPAQPRIGGAGPALEYAVRMREFPQAALASRALARGAFGAAEIDRLAALIAAFHSAAPATHDAARASGAGALDAALANFEQIAAAGAPAGASPLRALARWTRDEFSRVSTGMAARGRDGYVRECHGDLHLGNIALIDGAPVPFDCIEFSERLRWIDVMSEVAFLMMDLADRRRRDLAWRFLNRYLDATGDYGGVRVLRFYAVYRALVRAKVHLLRARQRGLGQAESARLEAATRDYLALARNLAHEGRAALIITHGLSGSGKTTATASLLEALGAVRTRSDLERKRLHGLPALAASGSAPGGGIYSHDATLATYRRIGECADAALRSGYPAIVDAAFLRRDEREAFRALAEKYDAPFVILDFHASPAVLRERIVQRRARGNNASEADLAVLERQIATREPLTPAEMAAAVTVQATHLPSPGMWRAVCDRLKEPERRHARHA